MNNSTGNLKLRPFEFGKTIFLLLSHFKPYKMVFFSWKEIIRLLRWKHLIFTFHLFPENDSILKHEFVRQWAVLEQKWCSYPAAHFTGFLRVFWVFAWWFIASKIFNIDPIRKIILFFYYQRETQWEGCVMCKKCLQLVSHTKARRSLRRSEQIKLAKRKRGWSMSEKTKHWFSKIKYLIISQHSCPQAWMMCTTLCKRYRRSFLSALPFVCACCSASPSVKHPRNYCIYI